MPNPRPITAIKQALRTFNQKCETDRAMYYARMAGSGVLLIWAACFFYVGIMWYLRGDAIVATLGQFGDSFGVINTFFTAMAIIGLVYTAHLQRVQLERQDHEIEESRKASIQQEHERSLTARLNAITTIYQIENKLFDLLEDSCNISYQHSASPEWRYLHSYTKSLKLLAEADLGFWDKRDKHFEGKIIQRSLMILIRSYAGMLILHQEQCNKDTTQKIIHRLQLALSTFLEYHDKDPVESIYDLLYASTNETLPRIGDSKQVNQDELQGLLAKLSAMADCLDSMTKADSVIK